MSNVWPQQDYNQLFEPAYTPTYVQGGIGTGSGIPIGPDVVVDMEFLSPSSGDVLVTPEFANHPRRPYMVLDIATGSNFNLADGTGITTEAQYRQLRYTFSSDFLKTRFNDPDATGYTRNFWLRGSVYSQGAAAVNQFVMNIQKPCPAIDFIQVIDGNDRIGVTYDPFTYDYAAINYVTLNGHVSNVPAGASLSLHITAYPDAAHLGTPVADWETPIVLNGNSFSYRFGETHIPTDEIVFLRLAMIDQFGEGYFITGYDDGNPLSAQLFPYQFDLCRDTQVNCLEMFNCASNITDNVKFCYITGEITGTGGWELVDEFERAEWRAGKYTATISEPSGNVWGEEIFVIDNSGATNSGIDAAPFYSGDVSVVSTTYNLDYDHFIEWSGTNSALYTRLYGRSVRSDLNNAPVTFKALRMTIPFSG